MIAKALTVAAALLLLLPAHALGDPAPQRTAYLRGGLTLHLSDSHTAGGLGGAVGVRTVVSGPWFAQAELGYLSVLGRTGELRVGAGWQRAGTWTPAVSAQLSVLFGDKLGFRSAERPFASAAPTVTPMLALAPLRFTGGGRTVSVLECGVGAGSDFRTIGTTWSVGLLEVGVGF